MADLIGAFVEVIAGLITAIAEAIPVIVEALVYLATGAVTIIAYALSGHFRERKRLEWKERPKRKYVDLGISSACVGVLTFLGFWVVLSRSEPTMSRSSHAIEQAQQSGEFRLVISSRSDVSSNEVRTSVKRGMIVKLLQRKLPHASRPTVTQSLEAVAGPLDPILARYKTAQLTGARRAA